MYWKIIENGTKFSSNKKKLLFFYQQIFYLIKKTRNKIGKP